LIVEKAATIQEWLEDQSLRQAERAKNVESVLTAAEISKQHDELIYFSTPILTRPKRKPPKIDGAKTPCSGAQTPNPPPKGGTPQPRRKAAQHKGRRRRT